LSHPHPMMSDMGLLLNFVAVVAAILMVIVGVYSMIAIWWDELD